MPWRHIDSNDASSIIILSSVPCTLETIVFNTRGTGSLKIYDCNDNEPNSTELFADFDLENTDLLIQYLGSGVELNEGLVLNVPANPGDITICWKGI